MDFTLDYASLAKKLECQELESPDGRASPQLYGQLLAIYLLFNNLTSAKFLWKRIPIEIKVHNQELSTIWCVGKLMWRRNYSEIYSVIQSYPAWPKHLKKIMNLLVESARQRAVKLIFESYSTVSVEDVSKLVGLSREDTLKLAQQNGWTHEPAEDLLVITRLNAQIRSNSSSGEGKALSKAVNLDEASNSLSETKYFSRGGTRTLESGTDLLEDLTDYIVFLEKATK